MKKLLLFLCVICFIGLLVGCGHNLTSSSKGYGINLSWQNDAYMPNLKLGYWQNSFICVRQNTKVQITNDSNISSSTEAGKETVSGVEAGGKVGNKIILKTGKQINGYTVDLKKVETSTGAEK